MITLQHKVMRKLYHYNCQIDFKILEQIIDMGTEAVPDLQAILIDAIENFEKYYFAELPENGCWFPTHALFLLAEIEADSAFPTILQFLSQPEQEFYNFWLGDMLTEDVYKVVAKCGKNSLGLIHHYLLSNHTIYLFARSAVSEGLSQIAIHYPDKRDEVVKIFNSILDRYLGGISKNPSALEKYLSIERDEDEEEFLSFIACDVMDIGASELEDKILLAFEKDLFDNTIIGKEDISFEIREYPLDNVFEIYTEYSKSMYGPEPEDEEADEQQIGRNDPCPCGSGKKYKKCCGKKEGD